MKRRIAHSTAGIPQSSDEAWRNLERARALLKDAARDLRDSEHATRLMRGGIMIDKDGDPWDPDGCMIELEEAAIAFGETVAKYGRLRRPAGA